MSTVQRSTNLVSAGRAFRFFHRLPYSIFQGEMKFNHAKFHISIFWHLLINIKLATHIRTCAYSELFFPTPNYHIFYPLRSLFFKKHLNIIKQLLLVKIQKLLIYFVIYSPLIIKGLKEVKPNEIYYIRNIIRFSNSSISFFLSFNAFIYSWIFFLSFAIYLLLLLKGFKDSDPRK